MFLAQRGISEVANVRDAEESASFWSHLHEIRSVVGLAHIIQLVADPGEVSTFGAVVASFRH
jgi:hypothetical protein